MNKLEHNIVNAGQKRHNDITIKNIPTTIETVSGLWTIRSMKAANSATKKRFAKNKKQTNSLWFLLAMQLFIKGQWWSINYILPNHAHQRKHHIYCNGTIESVL